MFDIAWIALLEVEDLVQWFRDQPALFAKVTRGVRAAESAESYLSMP